MLGEVRNLFLNPAYETLPLLVVRARLVPNIGERRSLEGVCREREASDGRREAGR